MNAEEWLLDIRGVEKEISELQAQYRHALERATNTTAAPIGERVQYSPGNSSEKKLIEVSEYAILIKKTLEKQERLRCEAFTLINRIGSVKHRLVLWLYYLEALSWEEVAERLGMSTRHVSGNLKKQALKMLEALRV